jgi:DNA-binding LacI/PurR family transcriptional regulator
VSTDLESEYKGRHVAVLNELSLSSPKISDFFARTIRHIAAELGDRGLTHRFYLGNTALGDEPPDRPTNKAFWDAFVQNQICGVIHITGVLSQVWTRQFEAAKIPIVGSGHGVNQVFTDNDAILTQGVDYLKRKGCRDIAVFWYSDMDDFSEAKMAVFDDEQLDVVQDVYTCGLNSGRLPSIQAVFPEIWMDPETRPDGVVIADELFLDEFFSVLGPLQISVPDQLQVITHRNAGHERDGDTKLPCLVLDPIENAEVIVDMLIRRLDDPATVQPSIGIQPKLMELTTTH